MNRDQWDKILLVDDDGTNRYIISKILRSAHYEVIEAATGKEALQLMNTSPCLVILDVGLPDMSGHDVCKILKCNPVTAVIPVLEMSAKYTAGINHVEAIEGGADGYLIQPVDAQILLATVRALIRLYQSERARELVMKTLEEAVRARDNFLAVASHELKTPLTSLLLHAQLRQKKLRLDQNPVLTPDQYKKMLEVDERQLRKLSTIVDNMLDISKLSVHGTKLVPIEFNLSDLINEIVERMRPQMEEAGCEIIIDPMPSISVNWDRLRIEQSIVNILNNCVLYAKGKPVLIQVISNETHVQVLIADQGMGIGKEHHERIFKIYERAVSKSEVSGMGLGLYIAKEAVKAHSGTISLQSEVGKGATFSIEIPKDFHSQPRA